MHPTFVKLFLEPDADDLLGDEERKRRVANRARRNRSHLTVRTTTRSGKAATPLRARPGSR